MKKYKVMFLLLCSIGAVGVAQVLNISNKNISYSFEANEEEIVFTDEETILINNHSFNLTDFSNLHVSEETEVDDNSVKVIFNSETAFIYVDGSLSEYLEINVSGAHVTITQSDDVSADTCGEITYILEGASDDGSFTLNGSYKASLLLNGLTLTNKLGAAIDIQNGKRIEVKAAKGTNNVLRDGDGDQKAALYCKGHLEFKGQGNLEVNGNKAHAISSKEYIELKNISLSIPTAVKDGINCNQYFKMESGSISIIDTGDDGIQVSFKDDADREAEDTGSFIFSGGKLSINIEKGEAAKGIKADGDINISGGDIEITTACNGIWDSSKLKTKASACIGADGDISISGGNLNLKASGSGGKGISCDGVFTSDGGDVNIETTGGMLVYSNNTLNHNYTSSADRISSDYKSSAKGIKADSGVIINDGDYQITTATNNAEGIESKKELKINGGELFIKAYDDGINSTENLYINGGKITVIAITGDGIDSNANLYISGGEIITLGSGGMEQGLDAADENRCYVYITGGSLLSFGGRNPVIAQTTNSQPLLSISGTIAAESTITVKDGEEVIANFIIPAEYTPSTGTSPRFGPGNGPGGGGWNPGGGSGNGKIILSSPQLETSKNYNIINGNTSSTSTSTLSVR